MGLLFGRTSAGETPAPPLSAAVPHPIYGPDPDASEETMMAGRGKQPYIRPLTARGIIPLGLNEFRALLSNQCHGLDKIRGPWGGTDFRRARFPVVPSCRFAHAPFLGGLCLTTTH